jgi:hypothetical protein
MFGKVSTNPDPDASATFFQDGQPEGTEHWITWKLPRPVTLGSVALVAKHDAPIDGFELRRALNSFTLFVKADTGWREIQRFQPALPYGAGADGTRLAVCLPARAFSATEFKAVFRQAVDILGQYSAPRVIALDGYAGTRCSVDAPTPAVDVKR